MSDLTVLRQRVEELEKELAECRAREEQVRQSEARYRHIFEQATAGIFQTSPEGRYLSINPAFARMFGYASQEEMMAAVSDIGAQIYVHPEEREQVMELLAEKGKVERLETRVYRSDGEIMWVSSNVRIVRDASGAILCYEGIVEDISERKAMEATLLEREKELKAKSLDLEETNTALRVLLKRREADQREFAASVLANLKELVFPYLDKLRESELKDPQRTYLSVVQSYLEEITAPFLRKLFREFSNLSRTERRIASLIREGKRNKEIAEILGVSMNTILSHRYHLRTKLGLKNKRVNLVSYLKSINGR